MKKKAEKFKCYRCKKTFEAIDGNMHFVADCIGVVENSHCDKCYIKHLEADNLRMLYVLDQIGRLAGNV